MDRPRIPDKVSRSHRAALIACNHFLHFFRTESAVLVVEAVARAVGGCHVKLHQMNVLAQNIGGRADLEIVNQIVVGYQIGMPVLDDVSRITTEEKRFRSCGWWQ